MVAEPGDKKLSSLPFPAIVGQEELKRVLLAVATDDDLDGTLVVGEKGTAKSTAVRGLVDLLPDQRAVADCPYGCHPDDPSLQCPSCRERDLEELEVETRPVPLVTLPLGATRDRVVGTLSVEDALAGSAEFDPGLLARAYRGILYIDEVNLLEDHLVDVILDAAASGVNTVERDGMSISHPAECTLIGTMNPEEGDLRPQLRDRFALQATVEGCREVDDRVSIIERTLNSGTDTEPRAEYAEELETLRSELLAARDRLPRVSLPDQFKHEIAETCLVAGVDGHRGDIAMARTAMALAALAGRTTVIETDVREAARYALPHRLRSTPFEEEPDLEEILDEQFEDSPGDEASEGPNESSSDDEPEPTGDDGGESGDQSHSEAGDQREGSNRSEEDSDGTTPSQSGLESDGDGQSAADDRSSGDSPGSGESSAKGDQNGSTDSAEGDDSSESETAQPLVPGQKRGEVAGVGEAASPDLECPSSEASTNSHGGGAGVSPSVDNRGVRVRTEPASEDGPIDAAASIRAATKRGQSRVESEDLRQSVRTGETSVTIVFAVDASASMRPAMRATKGVVLEMLRESYERRDEVAFVAFAGEDADVLLPPTDSVSLAARHLKELPSGDRTPLPAGLETARNVIEQAQPDASVVVLVTDGRATVSEGSPTASTREAARRLAATDAQVLVVDADDSSRAGLSKLVARETGGRRVDLSSLSVESVREAAAQAAADTR